MSDTVISEIDAKLLELEVQRVELYRKQVDSLLTQEDIERDCFREAMRGTLTLSITNPDDSPSACHKSPPVFIFSRNG